MKEETDEFREHFLKLYNDFEVFYDREMKTKSEPEMMACDFYKIFVRMNFEPILKKSEHWMNYIHKNTRQFFWADNQVLNQI